jgi:hypothetical protein
MTFSVLKYLKNVQRQMELLEPRRRLAFALWCSEPLLDSALDFLTDRLGESQVQRIREVLDSLWLYVEEGTAFDRELVARLRESLQQADWDDSQVGDAEQISEDAAMQAIEATIRVCEVAETGDPIAAAGACERVINHIDYELGMGGIRDPLSDPRMQRELATQAEMIESLRQAKHLQRVSRLL